MPTQIIHPQLGKGTIENKRYSGFEIFIRFQNGYSRWFSKLEVRHWMVDELDIISPEFKDIPPSAKEVVKIIDGQTQKLDEGKLHRESSPHAINSKFPSPVKAVISSPTIEDNIIIFPPKIVPKPNKPSIGTVSDTGIHKVEVMIKPAQDILDKRVPSGESVQAKDSFSPNIKFNLWEYCQEIEHAHKQPFAKSVATQDSVIPLDERGKNRRILEALRLGGVPQDLVTSFTCGRDEEVNNILSWLSSDNGALLLLGEYGSGKSHLLDLIKGIALYNGWVVARTEIDPKEVAFNKPKRVYQAVINSLEYMRADGEICGLREFVGDLMSCEEEALQQLEDHPILKNLVQGWSLEDDNDEIFEFLRGEGTIGNRLMPDFQTVANIFCNLISEIGWTSHNLLGLPGILILFDEAEAIDVRWYSTYSAERALNMFQGLLLMANSDPRLLTEHQDRLSYYKSCTHGGLTGLIYGFGYGVGSRKSRDYIPVPYIAEEESCTKIIFSFVPEMVESIDVLSPVHATVQNLPRCTIEPLGDGDYGELYERLREIYRIAYGFTPRYDIRSYLPRDKTRLFVKGVIESMDLERYNPEISADELFLNIGDLKYG